MDNEKDGNKKTELLFSKLILDLLETVPRRVRIPFLDIPSINLDVVELLMRQRTYFLAAFAVNVDEDIPSSRSQVQSFFL